MEKSKSVQGEQSEMKSFVERKTNDTVVFSFFTNLDENGNKADRTVFFGKKAIHSFDRDTNEIKTYLFEKIKDARFESFVGGATCLIFAEGEWVEFCRAFAEEKLNLSQFVRILKEVCDGVLKPEDAVFTPRKSVCPICRRPLAKGSSTCPACAEKKGMIGRLFSLMKGSFWWILLSIVLFFVHSVLNMLLPIIQGSFVDDFLNTKSPSSVLENYLPAILVVLSMALVRIFAVLSTIFRNNILSKVSVKTVLEIRRRLYEKIQSLSVAGISRHTAGDLMNRVSADTNVISQFLTNFLPSILEQSFVVVFVSVIIWISFHFFNFFPTRLEKNPSLISQTMD